MLYIIGVDIGTTGTKSVLFDITGTAIVDDYCGYEIISNSNGYAEQDALDWWNAVVKTVRTISKHIEDKENIVAISLSTQAGSLVTLDRQGELLGNAISWLDHRPDKEDLDKLIYGKSENYHYLNSGWKLTNCCNLAQAMWIKNKRPEIYEKIGKFLSTSDYINYKLTGKAVTDITNTGITNMVNLNKCEWNEEAIEALGITTDYLGKLEKPGTVIGCLKEAAAKELNLSDKTVVVNGATDQYCGSIGAGAVEDGDLMLATGTAWVVLGTTSRLMFDAKSFFAPCVHVVPDKFGVMATVPTGGISMEWLRKILSQPNAQKESFKDYDKFAKDIEPGSDGLFFYPHFFGSTCPTWKANVKGGFLGLKLNHERSHFIRAVMEGVAYETDGILQALSKAGWKIKQIRLIGGAAKSSLWRSIVSDVTGLPVVGIENSNAACAGAAMIAAVGLSFAKDYKQAAQMFCKQGDTIVPNQSNHQRYIKILEQYRNGFLHLERFYS